MRNHFNDQNLVVKYKCNVTVEKLGFFKVM